ncbi:hypothetical protein WL18_18395 [Burkholderia ubonensis]|uniref:hypothetical protein n=1 Tax=Burkholderia ubonensis TaxID=101571 RepID=UPI0007605E6A|nr:hypothetical protein [Burkholderia ubonensis]KVZ42292.1 hypothetical protein WL18_18395 [Burkholderia ubonensis]
MNKHHAGARGPVWKRIAATALAAACMAGMASAAQAADNAAPRHYLSLSLSRDGAGKLPWSDEPYSWITHDGKVLREGVTDANGRAAVARQAGETRYALDTINLRWNYMVDDACWARQGADFGRCVKMVDTVDKVSQRREEEERAEKEEAKTRRDAALARYRKAAAANDDELAWLGPLPAEWSVDDASHQIGDVFHKIEHDLDTMSAADVDVTRFVCKSPDQIGPAPDQQAVVDYLDSLRTPGTTTRQQWRALVEAARKGNWLARLQLFLVLGSRPQDDLVSQYRRGQLMAWLQANHVGAIYTYFLSQLAATGFFEGPSPGPSSPIYLYAAMRGSYSAMKKAGDALAGDDDPKTRASGERMRDCAVKMMPVLFAK